MSSFGCVWNWISYHKGGIQTEVVRDQRTIFRCWTKVHNNELIICDLHKIVTLLDN
jgi:hypothetical protein